MEKEIYTGGSSYDRINKKFVDDEGMERIESMLKEMELSLSDDHGYSFYYRPKDRSWWIYSQKENYNTVLEKSTANGIKKKYPYADLNNRKPVHWLD